MTKTTEELKRAMYQSLKIIRGYTHCAPVLNDFEASMESYLERLRQEAIDVDSRLNHASKMFSIVQDAYSRQQDLTSQARTEADQLRNKLQAFEFANKSAGEMLQAANEKIKRQRQSIGQLKNERDNAIHLAKVRTTQRDKLAQQLQEMRKIAKAPESDSEASFGDDTNPYGLEIQIASCRAAVDRWQATDGLTDRQVLLEIVGIIREIPE